MVSKEFFEFISSHCGNVVAWLLVLLPFFHLTFIIGRFICYLFREYKIVSQVIGHDSDTPLWMVAFELSCMDIYPSIMLYALLSMFYFDVKLGAILTMVSVIVCTHHKRQSEERYVPEYLLLYEPQISDRRQLRPLCR